MPRYLVTGGAGFIGSHIVDRLIGEGHTVRVLDDFSNGTMDNLSGARGRVEVVRGDLRDRLLVTQACEGIEAVIHTAAWRSVPKSMSDAVGYTDVNVLGTAHVLDAATAAGAKRVVLVSSSSVYGDGQPMPLKETLAPKPISPYALSKWVNELQGALYARSFGLETVSVRYFNVFGPRQSLDNDYAVVIPKFITCLLRGESPPVYGDGTQSRDFTYVDNVADATILASRAPGISGEVFNIALGEEHTLLDLLAELNRLIGTSVAPDFKPPRAGDVHRTLSDSSKAMARLNWRGSVGFTEGLRRTVAWFKTRTAVRA